MVDWSIGILVVLVLEVRGVWLCLLLFVAVFLFLFVSFEGEPLTPPRFSSPSQFILALREFILTLRELILALRELILALRELILALRELILALRELILYASRSRRGPFVLGALVHQPVNRLFEDSFQKTVD